MELLLHLGPRTAGVISYKLFLKYDHGIHDKITEPFDFYEHINDTWAYLVSSGYLSYRYVVLVR